MRVYFAAPLFSVAERRFNVALTERLDAAGLSIFLPQRDGAERDRPPYATMTPGTRRGRRFRARRGLHLQAPAAASQAPRWAPH